VKAGGAVELLNIEVDRELAGRGKVERNWIFLAEDGHHR
jgi:hypothetical protein